MNKLYFLLFAFLFLACSSNKIFVPGEKQEKVKNIYVEYYKLADEYLAKENYAKAIEYYNIALNEKSVHNLAYYKLGRAYALNKQYDKALVVFENILKTDENNVNLKSSIAYLVAMKGDSKKASSLYKDLVQQNPKDANLLVNYISILISIEDLETAKINLEYLTETFPDTPQIPSLKENFDKALENQKTNN